MLSNHGSQVLPFTGERGPGERGQIHFHQVTRGADAAPTGKASLERASKREGVSNPVPNVLECAQDEKGAVRGRSGLSPIMRHGFTCESASGLGLTYRDLAKTTNLRGPPGIRASKG